MGNTARKIFSSRGLSANADVVTRARRDKQTE